jgi:hypothetical protein
MWKTLLEGLKPCVGLDAKKQQETKDRIEEHNINKHERLVKKAERKKRRAERKLEKEQKKQ